MTITIAVDGTAASGNGTLAKRLASHSNFVHLDSGSLYRFTVLVVKFEPWRNRSRRRPALSLMCR